MRYTIIGNGPAGISAIEAIRQRDKTGSISVICDEPYKNYSRPLISYLLGRKLTLPELPFREDSFYQDNKVTLLLNKRAVKLNLQGKEVILQDKEKVAFDKLLIAVGGKPIIPQIKGKNLDGVFTFTTLSDARRIEEYIRRHKVKKAVVIGAGLIGLKATEALLEWDIRITILELADRILSSTFDKKASSIIEGALKKMGSRLITANTAVQIKGEKGKVKKVILKNRKVQPADLVIIAVGVRPDTALAEGTGIEKGRGIIVDKFMRTNIPDIYAAGDCCDGNPAIWPVAARQGRIAGWNMAGKKKEYENGMAMNSVQLCGIPTISVGETNPAGEDYEILEEFEPDKPHYRKIVMKDNRIVGAIFINGIERAGIYTGLIRDKVDTADFRDSLLSDDFGLVSLPKEYRKHLVSGEIAVI